MNRPKLLGMCVRAALAVSLPLGAVPVAGAVTITVDSAADAVPSQTRDGLCTLREAITAAQTNAPIDACAAGSSTADDEIVFAPALAGSTISVVADLGFSGSDTPGSLTVDGDVDNHGVGEITLSGQNQTRVVYVETGATVTLRHVTITDGNATGEATGSGLSAGGILNRGTLTLDHSAVSNCTAFVGGGIRNEGSLTLTASIVTGNNASVAGGLANTNSAVSASIIDSTFSGNHVSQSSGAIDNASSLTITNSTFTNNGAQYGGGAITAFQGHVTITHSTVSGNSAATVGGIYAYAANGATVTLINSVIAGNTNGNCAAEAGVAFPADGSGNLFFPSAGVCTGGAVGDPKLGPLRDNGGPTKTMLPGVGSMAVDMVTCAANVTTDQRGVARPRKLLPVLGPACDIGAVEVTATDRDTLFRDGFD